MPVSPRNTLTDRSRNTDLTTKSRPPQVQWSWHTQIKLQKSLKEFMKTKKLSLSNSLRNLCKCPALHPVFQGLPGGQILLTEDHSGLPERRATVLDPYYSTQRKSWLVTRASVCLWPDFCFLLIVFDGCWVPFKLFQCVTERTDMGSFSQLASFCLFRSQCWSQR